MEEQKEKGERKDSMIMVEMTKGATAIGPYRGMMILI